MILLAGRLTPTVAHARPETLAAIVAEQPSDIGVNCGRTQWGRICRDSAPLYAYWRDYSGITSYVTEAKFARYLVRCNEQAKLLYVNDALDTSQEIFDRCMKRELTRAE
jgi:hypothetical protein